jgi:site-specific DNA recombinase
MSEVLSAAARLTVDYCRISRDRNGSAEGVESQHLDNEEAAEDIGETIAKTYTDNDLSAFSGVERPAYEQLRRDIAADLIQIVIIWHAKRLHRDIEQAIAFMALCRTHRTKVYSQSHGWYNFERSQGRQSFLQHTLKGQGEFEERGERVSLARKRQARQGAYGGGVRPYGWGVDTGRVRSVCVNPKAPPAANVWRSAQANLSPPGGDVVDSTGPPLRGPSACRITPPLSCLLP